MNREQLSKNIMMAINSLLHEKSYVNAVKKRDLQFSKSGNPTIEKAYSTHFVKKQNKLS